MGRRIREQKSKQRALARTQSMQHSEGETDLLDSKTHDPSHTTKITPKKGAKTDEDLDSYIRQEDIFYDLQDNWEDDFASLLSQSCENYWETPFQDCLKGLWVSFMIDAVQMDIVRYEAWKKLQKEKMIH